MCANPLKKEYYFHVTAVTIEEVLEKNIETKVVGAFKQLGILDSRWREQIKFDICSEE
jgi:hypothetical protein